MSCNCSKLKDLPTCINSLIVSTIEDEDGTAFVFFKNTSNDHTIRLTADVNIDSLVTVDVSSIEFSPNYSYEIWITAIDAVPSDKKDITFDNYTFYNCLSVNFFRIENDSMEAVYYDTITAELE